MAAFLYKIPHLGYHARQRNTSRAAAKRGAGVPPAVSTAKTKGAGKMPALLRMIPPAEEIAITCPLMDSLERNILAAFDRIGARVLSLADFGELAAVSNVVAQLVERGWLRATRKPDTYARTEDGRLQLAGPRDVTIYSRPGCHLCEEAKTRIAPLLQEFGAHLTEINIDEDAQLRARYDFDVPVIFLGARKAAKHRVDLAQFRRQLRDASL
jgi:glutaredoxin